MKLIIIGVMRALLLVSVGIGILAVCVSDQENWTPSAKDVESLREIAFCEGGTGSEAGYGPRLVVIWKYASADEDSYPQLADNPQLLRSYLVHHDWILRGQLALLDHFGPERLRCFAAGARGEAEEFLPEGYTAEEAERAERLAAGIRKSDAGAFEETCAWLSETNFEALAYFTAQSRFAHLLVSGGARGGAEPKSLLTGVDPYWRVPVRELERRDLASLQAAAAPDEETLQRVTGLLRLRTEVFQYAANVETGTRLETMSPGIVCSIIADYGRCRGESSRCAKDEALEDVLPTFFKARIFVAECRGGAELAIDPAFIRPIRTVADLKVLRSEP